MPFVRYLAPVIRPFTIARKECTCQFHWSIALASSIGRLHLIGTEGSISNLSFEPCTSEYATSTGCADPKLPLILQWRQSGRGGTLPKESPRVD